MLKIHKGLKKKKKDKKNKRKEEELFDEEELEKYRKEHSNAVTATDSDVGQPCNSEQSDEWQKFKALTAGVDTILQKTQEDLDRIKSTSFFQRKAPPSEVEKLKEEAELGRSAAEDEQTARERKEEGGSFDQQSQQQQQPPKTDSEEESEEVEVDDTLFDTSYVDAVASGELKLAYIPDSPPDKEDDFDPFDTSYANKFIESNPKKRYLNLGCAVQVLSGRQTGDVDKSACPLFVEKKSPRRRPKPVDLLLTSFDEGVDATSAAAAAAAAVVERTSLDSPVKTLLDEDPLFARDDDIPPLSVTPIPAPLASTPVHPAVVCAAKSDNETDRKEDKLDLSDFDVLGKSTEVDVGASLLEQLHKAASSESTDDEFAQLAAESLARKSSSALPTPIGGVPLKSFDAVTPTTDFITAHPLQPVAPPVDDEIDPFDTSIVAKVILPGKQEIKLLEKELLSDIAVPVVPASIVDDDDFDPRAGESSPVKAIRPQELLIQRRAEAEKVVSPSKKPDFLKIEEIDGQVAKPLTPLAASNPQETTATEDYDPFDTSHICGAPGKLELKLIENELTKRDEHHNEQDEDDFDPRKYESVAGSHHQPASITRDILTKYSCDQHSLQQQQQPEEPTVIDILTGGEQDASAAHVISTPVLPEKYLADSPTEIAYSDPFDTSIADNIQPGKVELKLLETELIN